MCFMFYLQALIGQFSKYVGQEVYDINNQGKAEQRNKDDNRYAHQYQQYHRYGFCKGKLVYRQGAAEQQKSNPYIYYSKHGGIYGLYICREDLTDCQYNRNKHHKRKQAVAGSGINIGYGSLAVKKRGKAPV